MIIALSSATRMIQQELQAQNYFLVEIIDLLLVLRRFSSLILRSSSLSSKNLVKSRSSSTNIKPFVPKTNLHLEIQSIWKQFLDFCCCKIQIYRPLLIKKVQSEGNAVIYCKITNKFCACNILVGISSGNLRMRFFMLFRVADKNWPILIKLTWKHANRLHTLWSPFFAYIRNSFFC